MKKSCFLQSVIIGTILIASAIYIIETKFDDWFLQPGKNLIIDKMVNNWDQDLSYITDSEQKDSLKSLLIFYVENIESFNEVVQLEETDILNEFEMIIADSNITDPELSKFTLMIKKELNEKSKSH